MFLFKREPNTPVNAKEILFKVVIAAILFYVILYYLVPMITYEPLHTILSIGTVLVAIFFLFDLIF